MGHKRIKQRAEGKWDIPEGEREVYSSSTGMWGAVTRIRIWVRDETWWQRFIGVDRVMQVGLQTRIAPGIPDRETETLGQGLHSLLQSVIDRRPQPRAKVREWPAFMEVRAQNPDTRMMNGHQISLNHGGGVRKDLDLSYRGDGVKRRSPPLLRHSHDGGVAARPRVIGQVSHPPTLTANPPATWSSQQRGG